MITVNELFSGIGSQHAGMERLGIPYKIIGMAEIDKYAIKSYEAIHGPTRNYGDISKIEKLDYADFWTYSFPCQDISVAGKQRGITEETRSGLLYQVERLLEKSVSENEAPKWLMLENVKNLVGKKFRPDFDRWIHKLDKLGYNTYWKVLNAKDYGIPQNRERVFAISIRKDIDTGYAFPQPFELTKRLKDILEPEVDEKYYLSEEYQKRFFDSLSDKKMQEKIPHGNAYNILGTTVNKVAEGTNCRHWVHDINGCCSCLSATDYKQPKQILESVIAASRGRNTNNPSDRNPEVPTEQRLEINQNGTSNTITTVQKDNYVIEPNVLTPKRTEYGKQIRKEYESGLVQESRHNMTEMLPRNDGVSNTLTTVQKDNYVMIPQDTKQGYIECKVGGIADLSFPGSATRRGRVQDNGNICPTLMAGQQDVCYIEPIAYDEQNQYFRKDGCVGTLTTDGSSPKHNNRVMIDYSIRKLTPLECWRLMGFTDEQFYKAQAVNSNSQLYKQAGNSIVVDVLYWIFYQLFVNENKQQVIEEQDQLTGQMNIFDYIGG